MKINNRVISNQHLPYVIVELSENHNGSIETAFATIKAAKKLALMRLNYKLILQIQ